MELVQVHKNDQYRGTESFKATRSDNLKEDVRRQERRASVGIHKSIDICPHVPASLFSSCRRGVIRRLMQHILILVEMNSNQSVPYIGLVKPPERTREDEVRDKPASADPHPLHRYTRNRDLAAARHCCNELRAPFITGFKSPIGKKMAKKRGNDDELGSGSTVSPVVKRSRTTPPRRVVNVHSNRPNDSNITAEISSVTDTTSSSGSSSSDDIASEDDHETDQETASSGSPASSSSPSSSSSSENGDDEETTDLEDREATSEADINNEPIPFVPGRPGPRIKRVQGSGLLSRLSSFLPQLKAANEDLERDITTGRAQDVIMDDVQAESEDGQYIEMVRTLSLYLGQIMGFDTDGCGF
jgi:hypothetical protein